MVDAVYIDQNRIQVVKDSDIAFDSSRPSITLFPDSAQIVHNDFNIVFPSFIQARAYYYDQPSGNSYCELWSTVFWQEWGPDESNYNENYYPNAPGNSLPGPTTRRLTQQLLGTVPAEANWLDIRVRLRRTKTPDNWLNLQPPPPLFKLNEWIVLPGGSCPVENFRRTQRLFNIERSGNSMYLRRFQSVVNSNSSGAPLGNDQKDLSTEVGWNSNTNKLGPTGTNFSDGTSGANLNPRSNTELAGLIDQAGPSAGQKRPGQGNACAGGWPDLGSTYQADIVITPGIYRSSV